MSKSDTPTLGDLLSHLFDESPIRQIYERFGYRESWKVYPIDDGRDYHWLRTDNKFAFDRAPFTPESTVAGKFMGGVIYNADCVFEAEGYVMALLDTQCDGNVFLTVFDASKECKDPEILRLHEEYWA